MASVINTNIAATRTHNVYNRNNDYMNAAMTRVATGMKINSAKDGASTWAISEKMRERIRANDQANQNVQNDTAMLKTAQGGIANTIDILKTLKERAVNAANDSNMNSDRERIAVEVQELLTQINDNASKVKFNGRTLLDGTGGTDTTGGASGPKAAKMSSSATTGNMAVYSLKIGSAGTDKLTDNGFNVGDKITFSWVENGASAATTASYTVAEDSDFAALGTAISSAATNLTLSYEASGATLTGVTPAKTASNAGLYAIGADTVKITDFKVAVETEDGSTNATAQAAMVFTGEQQSQGVVATNTVYEVSFSGLYDSGTSAGGTVTEDTQLKNLTSTAAGASGDVAGASDNITVKWNDGSADQTNSGSLTGNSKIKDLFTAAGLTLVTGDGSALSLDGGTTTVKDKNGNDVTGTNGQIYAVGAADAKVKNLTFSGATSAEAALLNGIIGTNTQVAGDEVVSGNGNGNGNNNGGGTSTALTFYIGGETGFGITANISSMKVENLFNGSTVSQVADQFKDQAKAEAVISDINSALDTALNEQARLGAMENRLGYASDNLVTMNENLEAADSVMRDSDIAKEMTSYMKYAVLSQASQYMLAQAGQNAFQVLNLLQQ